MTLQNFLRLLRRQWILVVSLTVFGLALGTIIALSTPTRYTASTDVLVSVRVADDATAVERSQSTSYALQAMQTYGSVITSAIVMEPVIDELHLDTTPAALAARVSATVPLNSTVLTVTVTDPNPGQAARIANAIADSFSDVVTNTLEAREQATAFSFQVVRVQPAQVPTAPSAPNVRLTILLGGLLGLAAGIGAAILRATLDTRIRTSEDLDQAVDAPVIASIPFDDDAQKRPLIVVSDPRNPRAEAYRSLRTNVRFFIPNNKPGTFVLTSAGPSEGKSTVASNLAVTFAEAGYRVALVDADMRVPRLASYFGIEGGVGLSDVLAGRVRLNDVIQHWGRGTLFILPTGMVPPNPAELLGSDAMRQVVAALEAAFDIVLIDAPPVLPVTDATVAGKHAAGTILVAASGTTTSGALADAAARIEAADGRVLGTVLTMAPVKGADKTTAYGYAETA